MNSKPAFILIVDDDPITRKLLCEIFEKQGSQIIEASNGKEAIKLYKEQKIDLVITDIIMPEKEGIATIRELKEINPDIKIIAMSGGGAVQSEEYLKVAKLVGAKYTIEKPIDTENLIEKVNSLLSSH
jgi:CheY-like chemotaxis protein